MTDLREALEQLRLDQPAHAEAEEYWLLPSAFNSVLAAARAYADLLDNAVEVEITEGHPHSMDLPGRYLVWRAREEADGD